MPSPNEVYEPDIIKAVQQKLRWFKERGFPERAQPLLSKFRAGEYIAPCEYYMGPTITKNTALTLRQLNPPRNQSPESAPRWQSYAGNISDIDPEVLRHLSVDDIIGLLIAEGHYDPNWEENPPQNTVIGKLIHVPKRRHPNIVRTQAEGLMEELEMAE